MLLLKVHISMFVNKKLVEFTQFYLKMTHINSLNLTLFLFYLVVYSFLTYLKNKWNKWMVVVMYKERETIFKIKKNWYFNEI